MAGKTNEINLYRIALFLGILTFLTALAFVISQRVIFSNGNLELEFFFAKDFLIFSSGSVLLFLFLLVGKNKPQKFL